MKFQKYSKFCVRKNNSTVFFFYYYLKYYYIKEVEWSALTNFYMRIKYVFFPPESMLFYHLAYMANLDYTSSLRFIILTFDWLQLR